MHRSVGVLVVAYNAASTLAATLDRIPEDFRSRIDELIVMDDASNDETFAIGAQWAKRNPELRTTVLRHTKNLGYGGNQKVGYRLAREHGLDVVVMLHGDGQYAPEAMPGLVRPLLEGSADAVFGSRMMAKGAARAGGMPLYKYVGNRILTRAENRLLGAQLTEFHSGYRAYSLSALGEIPFEANSDGFDFDTQIIVQLLHEGKRILEVPIPTYYGDEICYVNGLRYAADVLRDVFEYRKVLAGFGTSDWVPREHEYQLKQDPCSSHGTLLAELAELPPGRVLDLGCSSGLFAEQARKLGHHVVGVDHLELAGVRDRVDEFHRADLNLGIPAQARTAEGYDVVVAADLIEHLARPDRLLREIREVLRPGGHALVCVPNAVHWYPRLRYVTGKFGYDRRGILDETHLRFFTRASFRRMLVDTGFDILAEHCQGLPLPVLAQATRSGRVPWQRLLAEADRLAVRVRPNLFAYQFSARVTPHSRETISAPGLLPVPGQSRSSRPTYAGI